MRRPPTTLAALWILSLACDSSPKPAPPGKVKQVEVEVDAKAGPRPGQKAEVNPEPPLAVKDGVKDPKDDSHVALPDSLLATGIPPIPRAIAEAVGAYSEARSATVLDWHPREHHLRVVVVVVRATQRKRHDVVKLVSHSRNACRLADAAQRMRSKPLSPARHPCRAARSRRCARIGCEHVAALRVRSH